jgi:hypothetical protein
LRARTMRRLRELLAELNEALQAAPANVDGGI